MSEQKVVQDALKKLKASRHLIEQDSTAIAPSDDDNGTGAINTVVCGPGDELAYHRMIREMKHEAEEDDQDE